MMPAAMSAELPSLDRALVSLARDGESDAREELARRVGRSAYVFALQLTDNPETAPTRWGGVDPRPFFVERVCRCISGE